MPDAYQIPVPAFVDRLHRWQLAVLQDTHRFRVLRWHRRARKTTLALNILIHEAHRTTKDIYAYIGPTYKQAKATIMHDPLMLKQYLPPQSLLKPWNETELMGTIASTGSVLMIKGADNPDSLRGIRFKGVVLDEWALQKPEIFTEILAPVLRENGGWALFPFTPKGRNHAYEFWRRGFNSAEYPDWKSFDLKASESGLLDPQQLIESAREMGDALYRQEMECEFLEGAQSVFQGWEACVSGQLEAPVLGHRYVMGVDLGRTHDATVLTVGDCSTRKVVAWQRLTETHWALQKSAIAQLARTYDASILIDSTGLGSPIEEDLRELGLSVEGFHFTEQSKRALIDGLRVAIAQRLIGFPRIEQLVDELQDFQMTLTPSGNVQYSAPSGEGYYDDSVISLALMVKALKSDLYVPRQQEWADSQYEAALEDMPVNQGFTFVSR